MSADQFTTLLVAAIRAVPGADESPVSAAELCRGVGFDATAAEVAGPLLMRLLNGFGVLRTATGVDGGPSVKAESQTALLFLHSLAEYLGAGRMMLDNWGRMGTVEPPYTEHEVLSGPQFLHLVERRRLRDDPEARPLRRTEVAQVVIGRRCRGRGSEYLVLHDPTARQYQLPGGHRRRGDLDPHDVAVRELQEELPGFAFDPARDRLVELGLERIVQVSRTYGVATEYRITFFHLRSTRRALAVGPSARWVRQAELLDPGGDIGSQALNMAGLRRLHHRLPGGVPGLGTSLDIRPRGWLPPAVQVDSLEFWGLVVAVLGLVSSFVFFVLAP
ncbi:NUDIX hydrolase [Micromonospora sp. NPDC049645]|uniref:NUDIX hydrolase n=1 Tax=Micromonospora sp. NPDC049645 TaxID=3155508 RepID=UPI003422A7FC